MSYRMFIDDERFPPGYINLWTICRTMDQVKAAIALQGFPCFISFDHDLGDGQPSGMDIAKWLVELDLNEQVIPSGFEFYVHSQNPVGEANIRLLLTQYLNNRAKRMEAYPL